MNCIPEPLVEDKSADVSRTYTGVLKASISTKKHLASCSLDYDLSKNKSRINPL